MLYLQRTVKICIYLTALAPAVFGQSAPYPFLASGYTQEIFGTVRTAPLQLGGVAFAPNGDVWTKICNSGDGPARFNLDRTVTTNGSTVHPQQTLPPSATNFGCGIANHPDGYLYVNTPGGAQRLDVNTGAV